MGDHAFTVEELAHPQPVAFRAGADRVVEGKQPWFQFAQRIAAFRTGKFGGEYQLGLIGVVHVRDPCEPVG
jgi:hypothetical protein